MIPPELQMSKLNQDNTDNLNSPITIKEIEFAIARLQKKNV